MKRIFGLILALVFCLCALLSCGVPANADDFVDSFVIALTNQDFKTVYSYFWSRGDLPSEEDFISSYQGFLDALGAQSITVENVSHTESSLEYTIVYSGEDLGDISNQCSLMMVEEDGARYIVYSSDMIMEGYSDGDRVTKVTTTGQRGEIFTADNVLIATNSYADTVYLDVTQVPNVEDGQSSITQLASLLELDQDESVDIMKKYTDALDKNYGTVIVDVRPKDSIDDALAAQITAIPGAAIDKTSMTVQRYYPYAGIYSHITGYVGSADEDDVARLEEMGLPSSTKVGKAGLEAQYDDYLQGQNGFQIRLYSSDGQFKQVLYEKPAVDGCDLYLSINSEMQSKAYYLMCSNMGDEQTGAAIVMDGSTGFLSAMVSYPSYDANVFNFALSSEEYYELFEAEDKLQPLYCRATQGLYPPGSLIKPFTAVPALESGSITADTVFPYTVTNNEWIPENWHWEPVRRNEETQGEMNLANCLSYSDNIFFSWLALEKIDQDTFLSYLEELGFGEAIPFDIPTAKSNLINEGREIEPVLISDMGFGQGELLLTPIQIASMYTVFQSGGDIMTPKLVKSIKQYNEDGEYVTVKSFEPEVWKESVVEPGALSTLSEALETVVESGTASSIQIEGVNLAAKTGTALKGDDKTKESSWISAWYQGMEENRLALVVVDGPRRQGQFKFRVAKELLQPDDGTPVISDVGDLPSEATSSASDEPESSQAAQ